MAKIRIDNAAYNSVGEQLKTDGEQSRMTLAMVVLAAIVCAVIVLLVVMK